MPRRRFKRLMSISNTKKIISLFLMLLISVAFFNISAFAQKKDSTNIKGLSINNSDTSFLNKTKIYIEKADNLFGTKMSNAGYYNRFVGNVQVRSDDVVMTCDSAYLYEAENKIKAFGSVDILKGGTSSAKADYVEYSGYNAQAILKDNVQIFEKGSQLITDDLIYNLNSKIGIYNNGGTLISDGTTVNSDYGRYNGKSKESYFKGNVFIANPDNDIESEELTYNTDSKEIVFLNQSTIYGKDAIIKTKQGRYNEKTGFAKFTKSTNIENSEQIISANKIIYNQKTGEGSAKENVVIVDKNENTIMYTDMADYNKESGYGIAVGHVRYIDTTENIELIAGKVEYNEFNKFLVATEKPILITVSDNDSIMIVSDTMVALRAVDIPLLNDRVKVYQEYSYRLLREKQAESFDENKLIQCNKNVQIYGDSMQAVCDSLIYFQSDSTFKLYKKPVVWSNTQQAEGDTIYLYTTNNKISKTELRSNAFIINDTEYPKMYNQIKGKDIDAFFKDNQIESAHVIGNAESIYYASNAEEKFLGLNKAEGARIKIFFKNKEVQRIVFYNKPKGAFYPMEKIPEQDRFLDGFQWRKELRPKSRKALRNR